MSVPSVRLESRPSAAPNAAWRPDWRRIVYHTLVSRALDDAEETTNLNKATVPREHLILYQFSASGHEVAQVILGSLLDGPHDAAGAYYRSRPLLLVAWAIDRRRPGQSTRSERRIQRRPRHWRRVQSAQASRRSGAAHVGGCGQPIHADGRLGAGDPVPSRHPERRRATPARSPSRWAAKRPWRPTGSGRPSPWRRRFGSRCSSTSRTTGSASPCAATCRRRVPTLLATWRRSAICSCATATAPIPASRRGSCTKSWPTCVRAPGRP